MQQQSLLYKIGITLVKGIGTITAKQVIDTLGDVSLLFREKARLLERIPGITHRVIAEIRSSEVLLRAEQEIRFIEKNKIIPLFISDKDYPSRLKECVDAPVMLYQRGKASLDAKRLISVVGTRHASSYGREVTDNLIRDIKEVYPDTFIVSGLAYGIDIAAHKAALRYHLPTLGVLAHGLDRIYPSEHRNTAIEMLENGALLTDFISGTKPDRPNFVKRNRIVAGISDCTVVIESAERGGALITASIADSYHKDVFAYPGRIGDPYSKGCNKIIKEKRAALITSAEDLFNEMGWSMQPKQSKPIQCDLFPNVSEKEQSVIHILNTKGKIQLNHLSIELNYSMSELTPLLFDLEMKGIVKCLPGGLYQLS